MSSNFLARIEQELTTRLIEIAEICLYRVFKIPMFHVEIQIF